MGYCLTSRALLNLTKIEKQLEAKIHDKTRRPSSKKVEIIKRENYDMKYGDQAQRLFSSSNVI